MSTRRSPTLPGGTRLLRVAGRLVDPRVRRNVVEPAIADLQHEARHVTAGRWTRSVVLCRGYAACVRVILLSLLSGRVLMRTWIRMWGAAAACCAVCAVILAAVYLPLPHVVFLVVSLLFVVPITEAAVAIGTRWSIRRALVLASTAVPLGYVVGGVIGWMSVPAAWTTSLWVTIDATMNAAKYGAAFEGTAENAILYFFYAGILGAVASAIAAVVATRAWARRARAVSPHPSSAGVLMAIVSVLLCLVAIPMVFFNPIIAGGISVAVGLMLVPDWQSESARRHGEPVRA